MVAHSPTPRRLATPRWLDLRLVLGVVLVLVAVLLGAVLVSRANHTHGIVTAREDLSAGTVLSATDLQISDVRVPGDGKGVYLDHLTDAVGHRLARDVSKGELVPAAAVRPVHAGTTVTIPFAADAAPDLHAGQRIEVWVSSPSCASVVLLPDVTVQQVRNDANGSLDSGDEGQDVVVDVDPTAAARVVAALAIDQAQIRAGILVGRSPQPAPSGSASPSAAAPAPASPTDAPSGSSGSGQLPGDLASCAGSSGDR